MTTEENWGQAAASISTEVDGYIDGLQLPQMRQPLEFGQEYAFPTNIRDLTAIAMGELGLKLEAWRGWLLKIMGKEISTVGTLRTAFEIAVPLEMQRIQDGRGTGKGSKVLSDNLRAMAIEGHAGLTAAQRDLMRRDAIIVRLQHQLLIYQGQLEKLSREQSRREMEAKFGG